MIDDGDPADLDMTIVALTNGPTYGGGFRITPDAVGDDGLLDVCILDKIGLASALWRLPFLVVGKHTKMKPVHMMRASALSTLSPSGRSKARSTARLCSRSTTTISILPGALECVVPEDDVRG